MTRTKALAWRTSWKPLAAPPPRHWPAQPNSCRLCAPPVWWTPHPEPSNTLTGWVGGPRADALANLTSSQLGELACEVLAPIFAVAPDFVRNQLVDCYTHDWQRDALSYGAYSYVPAGALDACSKMTLPAERTLYFAGEHTDTTGHWGTVHAAIRSGLRAAQQVLRG